MTVFQFKGFDGSGLEKAGQLEALSPTEAADILVQRGLVPFEIRAATAVKERQRALPSFFSRPQLTDYGSFARQAANLLEADFPIDHVLKFIAVAPTAPRLKSLADKLLEDITAGSALSSAVDRLAPGAPAYFSSIIRAGEMRGSLGPAFAELATLIETRVAISSRLRSALAYPVILALAATATLSIVLGVLVPTLLPLFEDAGTEPPFILLLARDVAVFFSRYHAPLAAATAAGFLGLLIAWRSEAARTVMARYRLKLPFWGAIERRSCVSIFSHILGTLVRAGTPLLTAMTIAARIPQNIVIVRSFEAARNKVEEGLRLSAALEQSREVPEIATKLIAVGEESGKLDHALIRLARLYEQQNDEAMTGAVTLLGPVLTVLIGGGIGMLMLSVMNATLSVNELAFR